MIFLFGNPTRNAGKFTLHVWIGAGPLEGAVDRLA